MTEHSTSEPSASNHSTSEPSASEHGASEPSGSEHSPAAPPVPERRPWERTHHGDTVVDPFDWLRDKDDPAVIAHLEAENAYTDAVTRHLDPLARTIAEEIRSHTQETDSSLPYRMGDFWYITRTREGDDYPRFTRLPAAGEHASAIPDVTEDELLEGEAVILDAQAMAKGEEFFSLGGLTISDCGRYMAYSLDTSGGEVYALRITDLDTGTVIDSAVTEVGYGLAFSADASHIFYTTNDASWRQHRVWSHQVGGPAADDRLVLEEPDEKFMLGFARARNGQALILQASSRTTSECWLLPLDDPGAEPQTVAGRTPGVEYTVDHAGDHLLVVHNRDVVGFELAVCPLGAIGPEGASSWSRVLAAGEGERIEDVDAFAAHLALSMRSGGLPAVRVIPRAKAEVASSTRSAPEARSAQAAWNGSDAWSTQAAWDISHGGELDAVEMSHNRDYDLTTIRYTLESMLTPVTYAEVDALGGSDQEPRVLKVAPVPNFDPEKYREHRLWAVAQDGTRIPISLVHRAELSADGTNPGFLYGYGSYEIPSDPSLVRSWLSLLDRGVVVAIAHVRGGGEMGREWYEDGKLLAKKNTFTDFVDCARHLVAEGWFNQDRVAAEGGSAGGLLMGAVANLAPDAFRVIHARVPFVDALTTILDPSLPLTVGEWEEWGNPLEDPEVYQYMKEYSPYENIQAVQYPAILATTSLNDIRVFFVEPAKWVARLREVTLNYSGGEPQHPILFKIEMVAGHGGKSGRYEQWKQRGEEFAFILDQIGARELLR